MLERFIKLYDDVRLATLALTGKWPFNQQDLDKLQDIWNSLKPIEVAIKTLGGKNVNLMDAEKIFAKVRHHLTAIGTPVGKDPNHTISADPAVVQRGKAQFSSQPNKRKAKSQVKSSKPKKRTLQTSSSSESDANIDEKDLVQSDPEIDEDSDEETLMI